MTAISEQTRRLFDEVIEKIIPSLQCLMNDLWMNWSHLGVDDETKTNNIQKLIAIEREHYGDVISETKRKVEDMQVEIEKLREETEQLSKCLSVDITIIDYKEDMMLTDYKKELEERISEYREQVQQRRMKMKRLLEWQRDLVAKLGVIPHELKDVPLPSEEELDQLKDRLTELQVERDNRTETFLNTQIEIKDIMETLQIKPSNKFEQTVMTAMSVDFVVNDKNMDLLNKLRLDLQEKYKQTNNRVLELRERLAKLWDCLEEDHIYRENFLHAHQGCHPRAEAAIKEEIKRCDQIKRQKIQVFVANVRTKIKLMWDNVMYSAGERESFIHYFQDVFTEDTLTLHEIYLDKITRFYNDNRQIFDLVMTRKNLWMKMSDLEARATDSTRYQNRGGQLLREEKERKAIGNKLPKIEEQLRELVGQYEARTGLTFTVEGKPLLQLMDDDWEAKKAERHNKQSARKQALTPQPPLLRSLAVSPLGKRNRTAAGLATHDGNKPPQKRQLITGSANKAYATINNNNHTALKRSAVTTVKRRISGRLAAKAFEGRGETVRKKLDYSTGNKNTPKVSVSASILKKKKRIDEAMRFTLEQQRHVSIRPALKQPAVIPIKSGGRRRSSKGASSSRAAPAPERDHSQPPAPPSPAAAAPNPLMESTMLTTYTDFKDRINENQIGRSSMANGITVKVKPATAENTPKKGPRKAPLTPKVGKENKHHMNVVTPKSNLMYTPTRLTRSATKLDQEGFATPRAPLSANKPNIQRHNAVTDMPLKPLTHVNRSKSHTQLIRAKNLPPII